MSDTELMAILEGILFLNGDNGINIKDIELSLKITSKKVKELIFKLNEKYNNNNHGITIQTFAKNTFRITTLKEHYEYYKNFRNNDLSPKKLSQPTLEVLSIVAYKGPITKMDIEKIRGTNSEYLINKLRDLEFIKEDPKRSHLPGRPYLFKVTNKFLKIFNINSVSELPEINLKNDNEVKDLFN